MADVFSREKRSQIMSRVRGRDNKATEIAMLAVLRRHRITGWRRQVRLFGKPDFVFLKQHVALFVDGCFWHGCPKHSSRPATNQAFWEEKLARNKSRDRLVSHTLKRRGWAVVRIWQHEFSEERELGIVRRIQRALQRVATRQELGSKSNRKNGRHGVKKTKLSPQLGDALDGVIAVRVLRLSRCRGQAGSRSA